MWRNKWLIFGVLALVAYWYWAKRKTVSSVPGSKDSTGMGSLPAIQRSLDKYVGNIS